MSTPPDIVFAESALIVEVPEADPLVGAFRARFDPTAALGIPPHITVLYPFIAPGQLDAAAIGTLRRFFAGQAPIAFQLEELHRFDCETLYLAPEPGEPFRAVTLGVWRLFPEAPPYGGRWPDIDPHLSVAHAAAGADLDQVANALKDARRHHEGLRAVAAAVALTAKESCAGPWRILERFRLGPGHPAAA